MSRSQRVIKRVFDIVVSLTMLTLFWWVLLIGYILASISTKSNGLYMQKRVGKEGKLFTIFKLKTMKPSSEIDTTVTTSHDSRITKVGKFLRKTKIDELPQLFNILIGDMSIVGPRPDVKGYADKLVGEDRMILKIRPGITGAATIKYKNEEEILASVDNPEIYNKEVIYPDKVKINKEYIKNYSFKNDLKYIFQTIVG